MDEAEKRCERLGNAEEGSLIMNILLVTPRPNNGIKEVRVDGSKKS